MKQRETIFLKAESEINTKKWYFKLNFKIINGWKSNIQMKINNILLLTK